MHARYKVRLAAIATVATLAMPVFASALTADEIKTQIQGLLAQIAALQQQLVDLKLQNRPTTTPATTTPAMQDKRGLCFMFARDIKFGMRGDDVKELQKQLADMADDDNFTEAHITGFFGAGTRDALMRMQMRAGLVATGTATSTVVFGPRTREFFKVHCDNRSEQGFLHGFLKKQMENVREWNKDMREKMRETQKDEMERMREAQKDMMEKMREERKDMMEKMHEKATTTTATTTQ